MTTLLDHLETQPLGSRNHAVTVNPAHMLGRGAHKGRISPGFDADLVLLAAEDWRYLAYHLAGPVVDTVVVGGRIAWRSRA